MATSVNPTTCSIFDKGLGCGVSTCAFTPNDNKATETNKTIFFIVIVFNFIPLISITGNENNNYTYIKS
ncbi:hypothetical protein GCM10009430_25510 [Aquimarina litoralis]|uniref:Uncharacterized protein n=1 Tax=Aquimarina litoralis TaxID=584605 RepID=A0ABP3U5A6_9FLAO